jgi:holo-[acyl-carrier protein] synthase
MIVGTGIDILEISRIKSAIEKSEHFLNKIFTNSELKYIINSNLKFERAAGIFCAKEAVSKAIGTGIRGFNWTDIEILKYNKGKPYVILYNNAKKICQNNDICDIIISISHSKCYAVANAIALNKF